MKYKSLLLRASIRMALPLMVFVVSPRAVALDALYLGGQVGYESNPPNADAIGFGVDVGLRSSAVVDLMLGFQTGTHGSLTNYRGTLSAEVHLGRAYDFDFTIGAGPGFYSFSSTGLNSTKFGLNG